MDTAKIHLQDYEIVSIERDYVESLEDFVDEDEWSTNATCPNENNVFKCWMGWLEGKPELAVVTQHN